MRRALALGLMLAGIPALAQTVPERDADGITDSAGLMAEAPEGALAETLAEIAADLDLRIEVLTVPEGGTLDAVARAAVESWGMNAGTGVLLAVSREPRLAVVVPGAGFGPVPPGATEGVAAALAPLLAEGAFEAAISEGVTLIQSRLVFPEDAAPLSDLPPANPAGLAEPVAEGGTVWRMLVSAAIFAIGLTFLWTRAARRAARLADRCPTCGAPGLEHRVTVLRPAEPGRSGLAERRTACPACSEATSEEIPLK